ncbi:hypothetical protein P872_12455 [Rhodonellum psychrophilum GCM71 = DSM 17998]|uniref:Response regulatory domain-containing protein n=2 Tax=Rhodonellum TaxID=336827 RepID=U5BJP8_9BACT|nr:MULTISPECIES: response regulator [Rhodonellum]ERM80670.1 hypothetical protein P872_12455 [Rhodonellum psychrophilum GCM71 = DSM 17998]SDZ32894.1 Response regulator receiver domain-containing protein [Rhodonellum ikkaensis]
MKYEVLIIDDEDLILTLVRKLIIKSKIHPSPLLFTTVNEALEYIQVEKTQDLCSLVLLDIHLPDFNAWDFLTALENFHPHSPIYVVMITSSINLSDRKKAEKFRQVIGYLEKPLLLADMESIKQLEPLSKFF